MARAPKESSSEPVSNKIAEARAKNLDLAIQQIQKDYGEGAILRMGEATHVDIAVIPTGNLLIDQSLGIGGFPRGMLDGSLPRIVNLSFIAPATASIRRATT